MTVAGWIARLARLPRYRADNGLRDHVTGALLRYTTADLFVRWADLVALGELPADSELPQAVTVIHHGPTFAERVKTWQLAHALPTPDETYLLVRDLWAALLDPDGAYTDRRGLPAAAERRADPAPPATWQPIATAPKNATWVIGLLANGDVRRVHWASDLSGSEQPAFEGWYYGNGSSFLGCDPTHWLPLPDPPRDFAAPPAADRKD